MRQYGHLGLYSPPTRGNEELALNAKNYSTITYSTDPLLIYIFDFLSNSEIDHILQATEKSFVASQVYNPGSPSHRNSSSCVLPPSDLLYDVVLKRSKAFLDTVIKNYPAAGVSYFDIEPLQLVRYGPDEYYHVHFDWFDILHREAKGWNPRLYNRVASFFIYLDDDCRGGETHFPRVNASGNGSEVVALEDHVSMAHTGSSFLPRRGNGIFWVNLLPNGHGDSRLLHAGLPVEEGSKVGMNIWVKKDFGR